MTALAPFPVHTSLMDVLTPDTVSNILASVDPPLFTHQRDFLREQLACTTSNLLAGEPGTGKTPVAAIIAWAVSLALYKQKTWQPSLYVAPSNLLAQLQRELKKFAPALRVVLIRSSKDKLPAPGTYDLLLISYTLPVAVKKIAEWLAALGMPEGALIAPSDGIALMIFDESQMLRNVTAQRTRFWVRFARRARWVLPMSGTPVVNSGEDLFTTFVMLNRLADLGVNSWGAFCKRFVQYQTVYIARGKTIQKPVGILNMETLNTVLGRHMTRWIAAELLDLPELIEEKHYFDIPDFWDELMKLARAEDPVDAVEQLEKVRDAFKQVVLRAPTQTEDEGLEIRVQQAIDDAGALAMSTYRRLAGQVKAPHTAEWIIDRLESGGGATLVFGHHQDVLNKLYTQITDAGIDAGLIYGDTPTVRRDAQILAFTEGKLKVLVLQTDVAGLGFNLQTASHVVFAELPWTGAAYQQAVARSHRAGQTQKVLVSVATVPDTIDDKIAGTIARKVRTAAAVLGDTEPAAGIALGV